MPEYTEHRDQIDVPRGTGREGFLRAIEALLKLPLIQEVKIDARGKVTYMRLLREGETPKPLEVDFETLQPMAVVRASSKITELTLSADSAGLCLAQLFSAVSQDKLHPIAFIGGANTVFFAWYKATMGIVIDEENVYGLPFYRDRMADDYMLFLVAAYSRQASLIHVQKSYKILMPQRVIPATQVSRP